MYVQQERVVWCRTSHKKVICTSSPNFLDFITALLLLTSLDLLSPFLAYKHVDILVLKNEKMLENIESLLYKRGH